MLVLIVSYICKENARERFMQAIKDEKIDKLSMAEDGNVRYEYFTPVNDDGKTLLLLESWRDEAASKAHRNTAHFQKLSKLKESLVTETLIENFEK